MPGQNVFSSALVLLFILVNAFRLNASCIKNLFHHEITDYERVANKLKETTSSGELEDNAQAALDIYSQPQCYTQGKGYNEILAALKEQRDMDEVEFCNGYRLEQLRRLAETMAANGNVSPKKITGPIKRLNRIIINQIIRVAGVCFVRLANTWPNPMNNDMNRPGMSENLLLLDSLPRSLLLDSQPDLKAKKIKQTMTQLSSMACSLIAEPEERKLFLKPYLHLLMAFNIINPKSEKLAKFYEDPRELIDLATVDHHNKELLKKVFRIRGCELLYESIEKTRSH